MSARSESIGGLGSSEVDPVTAPMTSGTCRAKVARTGFPNVTGSRSLRRSPANNIITTAASAPRSRRSRASRMAVPRRRIAHRTSTNITDSSSTMLAATRTPSHGGATRTSMDTTSGTYRRSQYRLMSRPYSAGAVTSTYRPMASRTHNALSHPSAAREGGPSQRLAITRRRMNEASSTDSSPCQRIAGVGQILPNVTATSRSTTAAARPIQRRQS